MIVSNVLFLQQIRIFYNSAWPDPYSTNLVWVTAVSGTKNNNSIMHIFSISSSNIRVVNVVCTIYIIIYIIVVILK